MVSFYAFPVIFIDTILVKKGTIIKRAGVRTPWTPPESAPGSKGQYNNQQSPAKSCLKQVTGIDRRYNPIYSKKKQKKKRR